MNSKQNAIAIITARGGSKRIPRKNIKEFCGYPIIRYSIKAAVDSGMFQEVMVSTDDMEIKTIAESYGAKCPFMRSEATSNDYATTADVIKEVLTNYKSMGRTFDKYCVIYPTAPFVTGDILRKAFEVLVKEQADFLTPVAQYNFPIQRCFCISDGKLKKKWPEYQNVRTQDLEPLYYDVGQFYIGDSEKIFCVPYEKRNMTALVLPEDIVQDIDTLEDWNKAEEKFRKVNK